MSKGAAGAVKSAKARRVPGVHGGGKARGSAGLLLLLLALAVATLAAYHPAWRGGLLWDDEQHLAAPALQSLDGLRRIWLEPGATQQYYPVVHSAFWLQHRLWGASTLGYHLVSIVLHALSAFLVGLILRRLAVPGAWLAAAIFAVHPVHVESVAWITELKNTLSGAFCLSAALAWLQFDESRRARHYAAALALFFLALLAKTVTAMLPIVLLAVAWWRRGRVEWRRDAWPLAPMVVLGAAAGMVTAWVERTHIIGTRAPEFQFTILERALIAGRAAWFYLAKLLWPADLTFIYPRWEISSTSWPQYLYPAAMLALAAALWAARRRSPAPLAALAAFLAALFPALGFVNVYPFRFSFVADHFQYLASIPIIALVAAGLVSLPRMWAGVSASSRRKASTWGEASASLRRDAPTWGEASASPWARTTAALIFAVCSPLAVLTWQQARDYADAETLYEATLRDNPSAWLAHVNLGVLRRDAAVPDYDRAAGHFREALHLRPDLPEAHYGLAFTLQKMGRGGEAVAEYQEAIRLAPGVAEAHGNLCNVLRDLGRLEEARAACEQAVALRPDAMQGRRNLAVTLQSIGQPLEALEQFRQAVRLAPGAAPLRYETANVLQMMGRLQEAEAEYREALRLQPAYPEAVNNLGFVLQNAGRVEEALSCHREALRLRPDFVDAYYYLGNALQQLGRPEEAAQEYRRALALNPSDAAVHNNLGLALEATGRRTEAAGHYRSALRLRPDLVQARIGLARVSPQ